MSLALAGWIYSLTVLVFMVGGHLIMLNITMPRIIFSFIMAVLTVGVHVWYALYTGQYGFLALLAGIVILAVAESRMVLNASQESQ